MNKLRVTLWCPEFRNCHGGVQQFSADVLEGFRACPKVASCHVVPWQSGGNPPWSKGAFAARAIFDLLFHRPNLVFITHLHLARISFILRLFGISYWVCLHGIDSWGKLTFKDQNSLRRAKKILCVSRYTQSRLLNEYPDLRSKTAIFANHVKPAEAFISRLEAKKRFDLLHAEPILITVSRLSASERYKGHREIISALPSLRKQYPKLCYLIAGDGDDRQDLESIVKALDLQSAVKFLGALSAEDLELAYAAADAFAMPSTGEGFGIVFLEALVRRLPVLGGNRDGSVDPLQDGLLGVLVDPHDPESVESGLKDLLSRKWDLDDLVSSTLAKFGADQIPQKLLTLLENS